MKTSEMKELIERAGHKDEEASAKLFVMSEDLAAEVIRLREREKVLVEALRGMVASYGFQFHTGSVALRNARAALTDTEG